MYTLAIFWEDYVPFFNLIGQHPPIGIQIYLFSVRVGLRILILEDLPNTPKYNFPKIAWHSQFLVPF